MVGQEIFVMNTSIFDISDISMGYSYVVLDLLMPFST